MFYDTSDWEVTKQIVLLQTLFVELFSPQHLWKKIELRHLYVKTFVCEEKPGKNNISPSKSVIIVWKLFYVCFHFTNSA